MKFTWICFITFLPFLLLAEDKITTISSLKYSVFSKSLDQNGKEINVKTDKILKSGETLQNKEKLPIKIFLRKKAKNNSQGYIQLSPEGRLKLNKTFTQRKENVNLQLLSGSIFVNHTNTLKEGEAFTIRTATSVAGVRGTQYQIELDYENTTTVKTIESTVYLQKIGKDKKVDIKAGMMSVGNEEPKPIPVEELKTLQSNFRHENFIEAIRKYNPRFYDHGYFKLKYNNEGEIDELAFELDKAEVDHSKLSTLESLSFLADPKIGPIKAFHLNKENVEDYRGLRYLKGTENISFNTNLTSKDLGYLPDDLPLKKVRLFGVKELDSIESLSRYSLENLVIIYGGKIKNFQPISKIKTLKHLMLFSVGPIKNLDFLKGLQLETINLTTASMNLDALRNMSSLKSLTIYNKKFTTEEFWKKYDAGEIK